VDDPNGLVVRWKSSGGPVVDRMMCDPASSSSVGIA